MVGHAVQQPFDDRMGLFDQREEIMSEEESARKEVKELELAAVKVLDKCEIFQISQTRFRELVSRTSE